MRKLCGAVSGRGLFWAGIVAEKRARNIRQTELLLGGWLLPRSPLVLQATGSAGELRSPGLHRLCLLSRGAAFYVSDSEDVGARFTVRWWEPSSSCGPDFSANAPEEPKKEWNSDDEEYDEFGRKKRRGGSKSNLKS